MGKHDFLLKTKKKGDTQTWDNIPPRIIDNLPEFEIGKLNKEDEKEEKIQREERRKNMIERNNVLKEEDEMKMKKKEEDEKEILQRLDECQLNDEDEEMTEDKSEKKMKTNL